MYGIFDTDILLRPSDKKQLRGYMSYVQGQLCTELTWTFCVGHEVQEDIWESRFEG
jgi:hypothetical protein